MIDWYRRPDQPRNRIANAKVGRLGPQAPVWHVPPEAGAEFGAVMGEVFKTDAQPYGPSHPVRRMGERPVQPMSQTYTSLESTATHTRRIENESWPTAVLVIHTEQIVR